MKCSCRVYRQRGESSLSEARISTTAVVTLKRGDRRTTGIRAAGQWSTLDVISHIGWQHDRSDIAPDIDHCLYQPPGPFAGVASDRAIGVHLRSRAVSVGA